MHPNQGFYPAGGQQAFYAPSAGIQPTHLAYLQPGSQAYARTMEPRLPHTESYLARDPAGMQGVEVMFRNLSYTVMKGKEELPILRDVSAYFLPGRMAAMMGPSGAGKTTLLDAIAGRKTVGKLEGDLLFGGKQPTPNYIKRYTGYVEQFDALVDVLTVEEMLMYTAELKRAHTPTLREEVSDLISNLGLQGCRATIIGNPLERGISGGQAKRVNIGIALIANPNVLFLDEPTTGLDSATADDIMSLVKGLCTRLGVTVCSTIHSPTSKTFALFDDLLLLVHGRVVFFGPLSHGGEAALAHFSSLVGSRPPADDNNLAEWLVLITGGGAEGVKHDVDFAAAYAQSPLAARAATVLGSMPPAGTAPRHDVASATATNFFSAVATLIKYRSSRNYVSSAFVAPRFAPQIIFAFLLFSLYLFDGSKNDPSSIVVVVSCLFMMVVLPAYGGASFVPSIVLDRKLHTRERNDGCYHVITYCVYKVAEESFIVLFSAAVFILVLFWSIQFQGNAGLFYLAYYMTAVTGVLCAYTFAALSPNMDVANSIFPTYTTILLFFVGLLMLETQFPPWWSWYRYLCYIRYPWRALMIDNFRAAGDPLLVGGFPGTTVLQFYNLGNVRKWDQLGYLTLFMGFFFVAFYVVLSYVRHEKR